MSFYGRWPRYVPVAQRRANAAREASKLAKQGRNLRPIWIQSRAIATSFWGAAWCKNLEVYADWANRMPRGRTYARNGSIVDLQIKPGQITALVNGSSLYEIKISIDKLEAGKWNAIRSDCASQVSSLLDLMRGKLPAAVLRRLTDPKMGMFPSPQELQAACSCPDYAYICKHVAATLYGVGHLLDTEPELFFKMRGVDQSELAADALTSQATSDAIGLNQQSGLEGEDLGAIFGIDLASTDDSASTGSSKSKAKGKAKPKSMPKPKSSVQTKPTAKRNSHGPKKAAAAKRQAAVKAAVKSTNKKATPKRATPKQAAPKPLAPKKAPAKKAAAKKTAPKKAAGKKAAGKKAAGKKAAGKKAVVKKAVVKKAVVKKAVVKKAAGKKAAKPTTSKNSATPKKPARKKAVAKQATAKQAGQAKPTKARSKAAKKPVRRATRSAQ